MTKTTKATKKPKLISLDKLAQAAECLKTLAHPHRLRMEQMMLHGRYPVGELACIEVGVHGRVQAAHGDRLLVEDLVEHALRSTFESIFKHCGMFSIV